jgi:aryl-alcohol dehydrogenase-like predicted oxidoreductase
VQYRRFGRKGWLVSEIGYGTWGIGGQWGPTDEREAEASLQRAVDLGCNFFDTAWAYGNGYSEQLLGSLVARNHDKTMFVATKIPPKNLKWPPRREDKLEDVFPPNHIREYTERSLTNLGLDCIPLMQLHVWEDAWSLDETLQQEIRSLSSEGLVDAWGISLNRWEPWNGLNALRTGLFDSVQVIYNIFDQNPEDELIPLCKELDIAVVCRVPFDEGSLTGHLSPESHWPVDDWRATYFGPENLLPTLERVQKLRPLVPGGMTMAQMALRFILSSPDIAAVIPGMRRRQHVDSNLSSSDGTKLSPALLAQLKKHRWDREPAEWLL